MRCKVPARWCGDLETNKTVPKEVRTSLLFTLLLSRPVSSKTDFHKHIPSQTHTSIRIRSSISLFLIAILQLQFGVSGCLVDKDLLFFYPLGQSENLFYQMCPCYLGTQESSQQKNRLASQNSRSWKSLSCRTSNLGWKSKRGCNGVSGYTLQWRLISRSNDEQLDRAFCLTVFDLLGWTSLVAQTVQNLPTMQESWVWSLGQEDPLEKGMATYSRAWRIPRTEEPGGLLSMGSQKVRHDWGTNTFTFTDSLFSSYKHVLYDVH